VIRRGALAAVALATAACTAPVNSVGRGPLAGRADIGGFELAYECHGQGAPTVILEAGLGASGIDAFFDFWEHVAATTRVCLYDRAGVGFSDPRPKSEHVTAGLMADELHRLLAAIDVPPPYVLAGHSYGGMAVRMFAARYPDEVAGMVLIEASSEPEVPIYERLHAGPWIDDTDRIDIHATVRQLHAAADVGDIPLIVVTAENISDEWLATTPALASKAQARLADLSTDAFQVVAPGSGHFVYTDDPDVVATAIQAVVEAARSKTGLYDCAQAFAQTDAICVKPGQIPSLTPA
jgi:pimeloyl-ACP methyl ester carboxylesterase